LCNSLPSWHFPETPTIFDDDNSGISPAGSLSAKDRTSEVGFFEVEIRNIGDRVAIESMEPTETAWNRDETIPPTLDPIEIKASTRAESERRDDARPGRIDAATREESPKPTAETARIRILQKLDNHEKRLQNQLQTLKTPVGEPEKLTRARSVLAAAKRRLQEATTKEETARNKIAVLDAQRPNSLIAKITGKAAKFAVRYEEVKRQRADAMRDLTFAQGHFDRSSFSLKAAKKQWEAEQQAIQRHRDQEISRVDSELRRIASTRAVLEQNPELALQPRKLAAAAARRCGRQATDIDPEVPCNLTRTLS